MTFAADSCGPNYTAHQCKLGNPNPIASSSQLPSAVRGVIMHLGQVLGDTGSTLVFSSTTRRLATEYCSTIDFHLTAARFLLPTWCEFTLVRQELLPMRVENWMTRRHVLLGAPSAIFYTFVSGTLRSEAVLASAR